MARTPLRTFRAPDDLWAAAQTEAAERGESVSAAILRFLIDYSQNHLVLPEPEVEANVAEYVDQAVRRALENYGITPAPTNNADDQNVPAQQSQDKSDAANQDAQ